MELKLNEFPHFNDEEVIFSFNTNDMTVSDVFELSIPVTQSNCYLRFQFLTKLGDIQFGIIYEGEDYQKDSLVLYKLRRVSSDIEIIESEIVIPLIGTVFLIWDNSYSWFNHKKLSYKVELLSSIPMDNKLVTIDKFLSSPLKNNSKLENSSDYQNRIEYDNKIELKNEPLNEIFSELKAFDTRLGEINEKFIR